MNYEKIIKIRNQFNRYTIHSIEEWTEMLGRFTDQQVMDVLKKKWRDIKDFSDMEFALIDLLSEEEQKKYLDDIIKPRIKKKLAALDQKEKS